MKLEQSFDVAAPVDRVWQALIDVEHVAPCLPGAAVTGRNEDGSYNGTFTVKVGPTTASYSGKLEMKDVDEQAHTATLHAHGTDKRGQGGANATIVSKVSDAGDGATRVEVDTDYHITGRLARFGRGGMIEDISARLLKEFANQLQLSLVGGPDGGAEAAAERASPRADGEQPSSPEDASPRPLSPPPPSRPAPSEPLQAHQVVGSVLLGRIRSNPWPLIAAVALLLVVLCRRRRRRHAGTERGPHRRGHDRRRRPR
jgi:uncharacterized protein